MFSSMSLIFLLALYLDGTIAKLCQIKDDCVPFDTCTNARDRATFNKSEKTMRMFREAFCGMSNDGKAKVCCSEFEPLSKTPTSLDNRLIDVDTLQSGDQTKDDLSRNGNLGNTGSDLTVVDTETQHKNLRLLPKSCGALYTFRIVGGVTASLYEFPWMALISYHEDEGLRFECAGTIINKRYILTAAHCVTNRNIAGVRVGEYDIRYDEDCYGNHCEPHIQDIQVEKKIVHEGYEGFPDYADDIALLRVAVDIDMSHRNVDPICLPVTRKLREDSITNRMGTVAGWGLTEENRESSRLLKVVIPVHANMVCQDHYRQMENPEVKKFCAGIYKKDSCRGDSGGPLMIEAQYNGIVKLVQFGIVSNGPLRCGTQTPGLYTDVRKYMDWILDKLEE